MKMPQVPPSEAEIWTEISMKPARYGEIMESVQQPTHDGRYMHWDELRYRTPKTNLTHRHWWFGLKLRRMAAGRRTAIRQA